MAPRPINADNMLLFITSPITSLHNLCKTLKDFTKVSGLWVNYTKSHTHNISLKPDTVVTLQCNFDFRWKDTSLEYLGINITAKIEHLYSANFPPTYEKLESDLKNWAGANYPGKVKYIP